jgi:crotonobetainyl-CoA:carnitine CoA-transferase CaiB-like acyl-CoA transferase
LRTVTPIGSARAIGAPIKFSETACGIERHAPALGEHTREVLGEHGFDAAQIDALLACGAAVQAG